MNRSIQEPTRRENITLRILILLGLGAMVNFFYWYLQPDFMDHPLLYGLLLGAIAFDSLRVVYIWYHYWDVSVPKPPKRTKAFTVDVLTTYFPGEPREMVKGTLLAIQRMRYPHTTYLCDEADDPDLRDFCEQNGIIHVTRDNRVDAKAGNINNALKQATGEICLILDPDHVPKESFLDEVLPYFEDDKVGFVQSVQAYYNVDESRVARGAAQQTFHFYGPIMMSMNSYGTVNAIGANCVFRRSALDSIGGHAAGLAEDMHTAMQLYAKGWRSVYVPEVFTKGLVPATLTSYYKQQLKWSRGTMELLVSVYPKLFKSFSWRQRVHFGILPLHYLSGFTVLITLLIPILSLFLSAMPWKGNILTFGYIFAPVLVSVLAIQFYVQRWVIDRSEWGMHLMGGVLLACTWWVNIIGTLYTLIRKKVPYLPTPKEDHGSTSWKLLVPNLAVGVISIVAIIYGLSADLTPFSMFMSGFALLNAFIMFYTVVLAREKPKPVVVSHAFPEPDPSPWRTVRTMGHLAWQKAALPIVMATMLLTAGLFYYSDYVKWAGVQPPVQQKNVINYVGIFAPQEDDGLTDLDTVHEITLGIEDRFDIISIYLAWDKQVDDHFPDALVDSIYAHQGIPMITWEPWLNTFEQEMAEAGHARDTHVYDLILSGFFDAYLSQFADKLMELDRPVFLRFAHEFDNPFYPWYMEGRAGSESFKQAWIHTYDLFKERGARNVIWIWNPWKADAFMEAYPGREYVDWIGVNVLNYAEYNQDGRWYSFKRLYQPYHAAIRQLPQTPVVIAEFGTLGTVQEKSRWMDEAFFAIENDYPEIKSLIYFNSSVDNNWPAGQEREGVMDWTVPGHAMIHHSFRNREVPAYVFTPFPVMSQEPHWPNRQGLSRFNSGPDLLSSRLDGLRGINLKQGADWRNNYHVLDRRKLLGDFEKIQQLGLNTLKITGNRVYDYNILQLTREAGLEVSYGFWIPESLDFMADSLGAAALTETIYQQVRRYKHHAHITSWNIQNDVLFNQKNFFHKPELFYQNRAYVHWVRELIAGIRELDPTRPVILDLEANMLTLHHTRLLHRHPGGIEIDAIGLVVKEEDQLTEITDYVEQFGQPYLYSEVDVDVLLQRNLPDSGESFFVTSWQDQYESNKLTFDGLVDRKGRPRAAYAALRDAMTQNEQAPKPFITRILKPARGVYGGGKMDYHAMVLDENAGWLHGQPDGDYTFEWALVKLDEHGNYLAVREVGDQPVLTLRVPENHAYFKLLLTVINGETITTEITPLYTPLVRD